MSSKSKESSKPENSTTTSSNDSTPSNETTQPTNSRLHNQIGEESNTTSTTTTQQTDQNTQENEPIQSENEWGGGNQNDDWGGGPNQTGWNTNNNWGTGGGGWSDGNSNWGTAYVGNNNNWGGGYSGGQWNFSSGFESSDSNWGPPQSLQQHQQQRKVDSSMRNLQRKIRIRVLIRGEVPVSPLTQHDHDKIVVNQLQLKKLKEKCKKSEDLIQAYADSWNNQIKRAQRVVDEKVKIFRKFVEDNKAALLKRIVVYEKLNEKQKKDNFVISKKTGFTPLLTHCSDVFEIIFSYLNQKELLRTIAVTTVFFYNIIVEKINLKVELTAESLRRFPMDYYLSNYRVTKLVLKRGEISELSKLDIKKLKTIIKGSKDNLRHFSFEFPFRMVTLDRIAMRKRQKGKKDDAKKEEKRKKLIKELLKDNVVSVILDCKKLESLNLQRYLFTEFYCGDISSLMKLGALKLRKLELEILSSIIMFRDKSGADFLINLAKYFSSPSNCIEELSFNSSQYHLSQGAISTSHMNVLIELFYSVMKLKKLRNFKYFILPAFNLKREFILFCLGLRKVKLIVLKKNNNGFLDGGGRNNNSNNNNNNNNTNVNHYFDLLKFLVEEFPKLKVKPILKIFLTNLRDATEFKYLNELPIEVGIYGRINRLFEGNINERLKMDVLKKSKIQTLRLFHTKSTAVRLFLVNSPIKNLYISLSVVNYEGNSVTMFNLSRELDGILFSLNFSKHIESITIVLNTRLKIHTFLNYCLKVLSFAVSFNKPSLREIVMLKKSSDYSSSYSYGGNNSNEVIEARVLNEVIFKTFKERDIILKELLEAVKNNKFIQTIRFFEESVIEKKINEVILNKSKKSKK